MIIIFRELGHKILTNAKMVGGAILANTKIFGQYLLANLKVLGHILYTAAIVSWAWIMTNPMVATLALSLCIIGLGLYYLRSNSKAHKILKTEFKGYKEFAGDRTKEQGASIRKLEDNLEHLEKTVQKYYELHKSTQVKADKNTAQLNQLVECFVTPILASYTTKSNTKPINAETILTVLNYLKQNDLREYHIDTPETPKIDTFTLSYTDTPYLILEPSVLDNFNSIIDQELFNRAAAMTDLLKNCQYALILNALDNPLDAHLLLQELSKETGKLKDTPKELKDIISKCSTLLSPETINLELMQEHTLQEIIQKHFKISANSDFSQSFLSTDSGEFLQRVINTQPKPPSPDFPNPRYIDTMMHTLEQERRSGSLITNFFKEVKRTLDGSMFSTTLSNDPIANATLIEKINKYLPSATGNFKELYKALEKALPALQQGTMLYNLRKNLADFTPVDLDMSTISVDSEVESTVIFHSTLNTYRDPLTIAAILAKPLPYTPVPLTASSLTQHNRDLAGAGSVGREVADLLPSTDSSPL